MRPCDCKDQVDARKLKEIGLKFNNDSIEVHPNYVLLEFGSTTIKVGMKRFRQFAEWYLEDQDLLCPGNGRKNEPL